VGQPYGTARGQAARLDETGGSHEHEALLAVADVIAMAKVSFGNHSSVLVRRQDRDSIRKFL
jgi:hypothetical protein